MGIRESETECAAVAVAPRVSLASMEAKIISVHHFRMSEALKAMNALVKAQIDDIPASLDLLSVCVIVMENGFSVIGKSAPASAENFNAELGKKLAYEDAIRQLWPLEGYALRERLLAS